MNEDYESFGPDTSLHGSNLFDEDDYPMNLGLSDESSPDPDFVNKNLFIVEYEMSLMLSAETCGELPALAKILRVPQPVIEVRLKEHNERMGALEQKASILFDPEQYYNVEDDGNINTKVDPELEPISHSATLVTNDERDKFQPFCMCGAEQSDVCICEFAERLDLPDGAI